MRSEGPTSRGHAARPRGWAEPQPGTNGAGHNGKDEGPAVITGGAGFIGTNLADRLARSGRRVILFDNLSRAGVAQNLAWLRRTHGERVHHIKGDVRDAQALKQVVAGASQVYHFAAQVAVTTSLVQPIEDFEINARGTLNLLEALRALPHPPPLMFTSTNKVYGDLKEVELRLRHGRYEPENEAVRRHGFSEAQSLSFHSPYGCSKGAACQYVQDYARTFGLPAVVFRMSCIYGPHQFGNEDQGWVAHFLIRALQGEPITVYGDGCQVRDILFVEDLVDAFLLAQQHMYKLAGQVFNMGGGPANTISLLELVDLIKRVHGRKPEVLLAEWRAADQQYYVSDTRKFSASTGWTARVGVREGIHRLYDWLTEFRAASVRAQGLNGTHPRPRSKSLRVRRVRMPAAPRPVRITRTNNLRRVAVSAGRNGHKRA